MAGAGVTGTATRATLPVLRALLDQARRKNYASGVLGVRARPEWPGSPTFTHESVPVRVVPCVSALAVREALLDRERGQWLVVLTDRADDDLGAGVLSHLVWNRLRTPDPWDAVRLRFAANGVEPALTTTAEDREIATGLLMAAPLAGWPPAPGGVLTRDHALGAVAAAHLGLTDPVVDATSVLAWTTDPTLVTRVADLRALAGDALTSAVLAWVAERAGAAGQPLLPLLRAGEARDAVPLGLVAGLLADAQDGTTGGPARSGTGARGRDRRAGRPRGADPPRAAAGRCPPVRRHAAVLGPRVVDGAVRDASRPRAARSRPGPAGPRRRTARRGACRQPGGWFGPAACRADPPARLAGGHPAFRAGGRADAAAGRAGCTADASAAALADIEQAWIGVAAHRLADADPRVPAFHAAVRLARWLATDSSASGTSLPALLGRHADSDALGRLGRQRRHAGRERPRPRRRARRRAGRDADPAGRPRRGVRRRAGRAHRQRYRRPATTSSCTWKNSCRRW